MFTPSLPWLYAAAPGLAGTAVLVILIILIASFFVSWSFWNRFQHYRRETDQLAQVEHIFASQDSGEFTTGVPGDSVTGRFIADIQRKISPRDAADLADQRDSASTATVIGNTLLGVLLIIGLAGTLLSFKEALGEPPALGESGSMDAKAVENYSRSVYSGMTGAFLPSFWGIAATVILFIIRGIVVNHSRDRLFLNLEDFGHRLFEKVNPPPPNQTGALINTVSKLDDVAAKLQAACSGLATSNEAAETSAESLVTAANGLRAAVEMMNASFADRGTIANRLGRLAKTIEKLESVVGLVGEQTGSLEGHLHGTSDSVEASVAALSAARDATIKTVNKAQASLEAVDGIILATQNKMQETLELQGQLIEQTKSKLEEATQAAKTQASKAADAIRTAGKQLQDDLTKTIANEGGKLTTHTEAVIKRAEKVAETARSAAKTTAESVRGVEASAAQMAHTVRTLAQKSSDIPRRETWTQKGGGVGRQESVDLVRPPIRPPVQDPTLDSAKSAPHAKTADRRIESGGSIFDDIESESGAPPLKPRPVQTPEASASDPAIVADASASNSLGGEAGIPPDNSIVERGKSLAPIEKHPGAVKTFLGKLFRRQK